MVSCELRETPKITARVLALAAVALPYAGFSQALSEPADDALRQLVEEIEERQRSGPFSEDSIDPLTALSLLFQEAGDHDLAAVTIQLALQAVRVNRGLHSFDQAPLIRQSIRNEEARGNDAVAWSLEQDLLTLLRRHSDDVRTIPILREIGDGRMALLRRYLSGEIPPQVILGCYYRPEHLEEGSCTSGSRRVVVQRILADAWNSYSEAIDVYHRHEHYASDELRELETELLRSSYLYGNYGLGSESLQRLVAYDVANSAPWLTRLEGLVRLADWDLLFGRIQPAYETYRQAYDLLEREGAAPASIERLFSPEQPIVLPTFLSNPLASDAQGNIGFIDVAFDISLHGRARRVKILETTTGATKDAKKRLVRLISQSRFRPRVVDGEFPRKSHAVLRYHLSEQQDAISDESDNDHVRRRNIRNYRDGLSGVPRLFTGHVPLPAEDVGAESE